METFLKIIHTTFLNVAKTYSKKMIVEKKKVHCQREQGRHSHTRLGIFCLNLYNSHFYR